MFDTIIVGCGPAGMTAALNLLRNNRSVLILEKENVGGQIALSPRLENYPSIQSISGAQFADNLFEQITKLGAQFEYEEVLKIEKENDNYKVTTNYHTYESKTVILATGAKHKKLNVEGEEKLLGKGISYCATCDGPFYKDKNVIVIGDANSALQYAIDLSKYCNHVEIITLFDKFFADQYLLDIMDKTSNISYKHNLSCVKFKGIKELKEVIFKNTKTNEEIIIPIDGCFIAIGQEPDVNFASNLINTENGFIIVDNNFETKSKGLYAIGDCIKKEVRQVVTATSDGAIAASIINKRL